MKITEGADLAPLNSFGVPARAALMAVIESEEDLLELPAFNPGRDYVLGGGSNVLFLQDIPGMLYRVQIPGRTIVYESPNECLVDVGAGENWHELVRWTLNQGLYGLENLSLIPGLAGAAPYQNIGAYGVELSDVLESVTTWDWRACHWRELAARDCSLAYRDSRFKSADRNRFLITSIRLRLSRVFRPQLDYAGLSQELERMGCPDPDAGQVSQAVIAMRRARLPDWREQPNAGSFFKNPVIDGALLDDLRRQLPDLPHWPSPDGGYKVPAARLIESCGLKGFSLGPAAVSGQHALVLVNRGGARGVDIAALANHVQATVFDRWGVTLEPEIQTVQFE